MKLVQALAVAVVLEVAVQRLHDAFAKAMHSERHLQELGVPTAVHYPIPLHLQPAFADLGQGEGSFPLAEAAGKRVMSLPMHPFLDDATQDAIVAAVKKALA